MDQAPGHLQVDALAAGARRDQDGRAAGRAEAGHLGVALGVALAADDQRGALARALLDSRKRANAITVSIGCANSTTFSSCPARWFVGACRNMPPEPTQRVLDFLTEKGWPSGEEFMARFVRFNPYESKYAKPVLASLEHASQAKSEPVGLDACSIEHVLPQTIDESDDNGRAWIKALGDPWTQAHAEWLHTPGNLTLVGADYNAGMSNRAFELKRPVLAASKVYLNHHFQTATDWTPAEIEARGRKLAALAAALWPARPSP